MKSTPPDTDILSNFSETLSELMFDAHMTPEALSKAIGADLSVIYRYLRKEQLPTLQRALAIADLFACSLDYLFGLSHAEPHMTYRPAPPFAERFPDSTFVPGKKAWSVKCDIALPCAFQNELTGDDARELLTNGTWCAAEVSNMGCTPEAIAEFQKAGILFAPGKAVNAGGVATSGLEMTQNAQHLSWSAEEVDKKLHYIMSQIHEACVTYGTQPDGYINYVKGANVAGFMKVAHAMLEQGII